jgi:hypothetical protein
MITANRLETAGPVVMAFLGAMPAPSQHAGLAPADPGRRPEAAAARLRLG